MTSPLLPEIFWQRLIFFHPMKTILFSFALLALTVSSLRANDIIVMKKIVATKGATYSETNPGVTPTGATPAAFTASETSYLVIDLTASNFVEVTYSAAGSPLIKTMVIGSSQPISDLWDLKQAIKGTAGSFIYSYQKGSHVTDATDTDGDTVNDSFVESFQSLHYNGKASPLVVSKTLTIQAVPRTLTGKIVETTFQDDDAITLPEGTVPASRSFTKNAGTVTITLDATLTPASNTTPVAGTIDLAPGTVTPKAAATLDNGLQRVRDALYRLGYRLPTV